VSAEEPNFGDLLSQVQQMQQRLMDAQRSAGAQAVEGSAGGGVVTIKVTGSLEVIDVTIDPSVVDPGDVEMLQDLVLAAMRDAVDRANELNRQAFGGLGLGGGLGRELGGGLEGLTGG
jgi:DNA-binding YbaB/EbfC family protein